jgi:ferredoxin
MRSETVDDRKDWPMPRSTRNVPVVLLCCLTAALGSQCTAQAPIGPDSTLQSIAHGSGVRGGDLAEALGLDREVEKTKTLAELGVAPERAEEALTELTPPTSAAGSAGPKAEAGHARGGEGEGAHRGEGQADRASNPLYGAYALLVALAAAYLLWFGVRRGEKRARWYPQSFYVAVLLLSVVGVGFLLHGKFVSPMGAVERAIKAITGAFESPGPQLAALAFFLVLAIVANKVVCGWACPFGALQELLYTLPLFRALKRKRLPFWLTNSVRAALLCAALLLIFGVLGGRRGFMLYHYLNPFNLFILEFGTRTVVLFLAAYLLTGLFFYRPFCQFICPFGLVSWLVERLSLTRVRIDPARCTDCKACAKSCPLAAAEGRLQRKPLPADCFSCMRCLRVCPADAIHYRTAWGPPSPAAPELAPPAITPEQD